MKSKYKPTSPVITGPSLVCRRLCDVPAYHAQFEQAVLAAITNDYDDITPAFAQNLIAIDSQEGDPHGYFTLGKEVWVAFDPDERFVGFEVITRKRGGSVKLGPTFIAPEHRGKGRAKEMIELILSAYQASGARKVYVTAPLANAATVSLDFKHLGFQLEALLNDHYKPGSAERICGRFLGDTPCLPLDSVHAGYVDEAANLTSVSGFGRATPDDVYALLQEVMATDYDDIDRSFVAAMFSGAQQGRASYEHKPKIVHTLFAGDRLIGVAPIAPKRGGTYKVAPFIIDPAFRSRQAINMLLNACLQAAAQDQRRKIAIVVPVRDSNVIDGILSEAFYAEGILRSPYKTGSDMVVLSKRLTV
jgi:GNAT superfamily N-acetyltransferase